MKPVATLRTAVGGWNRFWFEPQATATLALFRVAFGLVAFVWAVSLIPNVTAFYGPDGILPSPPERRPFEWGLLLSWFPSPVVAMIVVAGTAAAAIAVTVGAFTRTASVLLAIGMMCIEQRNVYVTNAGDSLIRDLAFLLVLTPAGAALSVDRLRIARDRFWEFPPRAPWGLRLVQIQISLGYLAAFWQKSGSDLWRNEEAVAYALRITDIQRFPTPEFVTSSIHVTSALTLGTVLLELALGILIWNRALRPWVIGFGVCFHLGINWSIMVGFFSWAMIAGYVSFTPPEASTRFVLATRNRFSALTLKARRAQEDSPPVA